MGSGKGFFVTFEGLDGCGKTTQIQRLSQLLQAAGVDFIATRQPGGTETGNRIRALLLDSKSTGIARLAELGLMFSDRAQSLYEVILPALDAGKVVLCDRFSDSTEAYQGGGRQLGSKIVHELHETLCGGIQPDLTFLLVGNPQADLERARARNSQTGSHYGHDRDHDPDEDRFEREHATFHDRVLQAYLVIAERERQRVVKIDAARSIEEVHGDIVKAFEERLKKQLVAQSPATAR